MVLTEQRADLLVADEDFPEQCAAVPQLSFAGAQLAVLLDSSMILRKRFRPAVALAAIGEHRVTTLIGVPVMLQWMLDVPDHGDTSSLRVVAVSGSALTASLAERVMDAFGPVLYNLYGSTEVSWASIATPEEMRTSPGTVGSPPLGTQLGILDGDDRSVPPGETGRIFVGNDMLFEGYTPRGRHRVRRRAAGHRRRGMIDSHGLLHVTGRSDDMIVSGGENVYPGEVEDVIASWPEVREAAVVGVADEDYGQRLAAHLVLELNRRLPRVDHARMRTEADEFFGTLDRAGDDDPWERRRA